MRRRANIQCGAALEPHDHVVWFGDGRADLYSVASAALVEGAHRREKLILVSEEPDPALLSGVDRLEFLLASGQLELLAVDAVYGTGRGFSAAAQLETFEGVLAAALADGYRGIRVVADNTPLVLGDDASFHRWLAWEQLTDRFQAGSMVTGVCFFDRSALSEQRQTDLAAVHPVRSASIAEPPFSVFSDGDAAVIAGTLDAMSNEQFRRIVATFPPDRPLVVDLAEVEVMDRQDLLVLVEAASADRPLLIRGAGHLRELVSPLQTATPHVRFQYGSSSVPRCAGCGDVIGVYEPAVIVGNGAGRMTSGANDPDALDGAAERYHRACYPSH